MMALCATGIVKTYETTPPIEVLAGVDLSVDKGERIAIMGRSGAGKSTLLNVLGLLDEPTEGSLSILGRDVGQVTAKERDRLRGSHIGFVFQDHHVLGRRSCADNVALKLSIVEHARQARRTAVNAALEQVGLQARAQSPGRLLSGGEKQRLAIARAIVGRPSLILADEPTGNLDSDNAQLILKLFDNQARSGVSVVVITHDSAIAGWADQVYLLESGSLAPMSRSAVRGLL